MLKKILFAIVLITSHFASIKTHAQYYSSGEMPASIHWQQINTAKYRLVFPSTFAPYAKTLAATIDTSLVFTTRTMGRFPKKYNILVHAQSAYSNGFMTWTPKRMELYPTPPQDGMTQDWIQHLVMHEHRHLAQIDQLDRGFVHALSFVVGQHAMGAAIGIHYPMWFLEGDATLTETLLSETGRGRMPWFENQLKAQLLEKRAYSYDKAYLGSYRDFVPNYYVMGYHLVTATRQWYGPDVWQNVTHGIAHHSWYPWEFNREIKKATGLRKVDLYQAVFDSLKQVWSKQDAENSYTDNQLLTSPSKRFKTYMYPQYTDQGVLVAEVSGPDEATRFVAIDPQGKEHTLLQPGIRNDEPFCVSGHKMVWSEQVDHVRWPNAPSSAIKLFDMDTQQCRFVGPRTMKLFAPNLSADGRKIVAVSISKSNHASVVVIDTQSGQLTQTLDIENDMLLSPQWIDDERLLLIAQNSQGKRLIVYNRSTKETDTWFGPTHDDIRYPRADHGAILFAHCANGYENIFMIDAANHQPTQLTHERFGATAPSVYNHQLVYSRYTANGYKVATANLASANVDAATVTPHHWLFEGLEKQEMGRPNFTNADTTAYDIKPYSKWHLFNFHSWAPAHIDLEDQTIHNGVTLLSQNLLNTLFVQAGYNADPNYKTEKYVAKLSYKGFFPQLDLTVKAGDTKVFYNNAYRNATDTFYLKANTKQYYLQFLPGVSIPLNLSRGAWSRYLTPSAQLMLYKQSGYDYQKADITLKNNKLVVGTFEELHVADFLSKDLEYDLFGYNLKRGSRNDIGTRWGQVFELNYRYSPWGNHSRGTQLAALSRLYFPGIGRHHSIKIENNWQWRTHGENYAHTNSYYLYRHFTSVVQMPRGYSPTDAHDLYSFKGNYSLPLLNPDVSVGGLAYLKRLSTNLFYDYSVADYRQKSVIDQTIRTFTQHYSSVGADMVAEIHPLRFVLPLEIGVRTAYLPNEKGFYTELLLNLNLSSYLVNRH